MKSIDIKPAKLSKSISGFANATGGDLYIGIDEVDEGESKRRIWRGFPDVESANGHIQIFEQLFPLGQYYSYTFLTTEECCGLVLQVTVQKSRDIAKASDSTPYLRRSAQNLPVNTPEALARLRLDKGIESFEKETINVDIILITESESILEFISTVIPTAEPQIWLAKQLLIIQEKPTVSGVLLFADEPQAILPKRCGIKIYRYKTIASEGTRDTLAFDPLTVEGNLYEQIKKSVAKTVELVEDIPKVGKKGLESIRYPEETIHEIITNAVLHRDYSIPIDIHIRIFDNRIEIESPGRLPGHITPRNILKEQYARNGTIVRIINKFPNPPNKDVGEGLNTAFFAMGKLRLKPPIIQENENSVIVYIKHERLASAEATIMEYLDTNVEITNQIARQLTGVSADAVKLAFNKLKDRGLIELIPGKLRWRRIREGDQPLEVFPTRAELYPRIEKLVMEYLNSHEEITNRTAREITRVESGTKMKDFFYSMRNKGLIELISGKTTAQAAWRKVKKNNC